MMMIKGDRDPGHLPSEKLLAEMGKYNEELVKAGIMLDGDGLKPSSAGARVRFSGADRMVIDGPFAETKELIAGYWIWQVDSLEEAIEWVKRCPNPMGQESVVEIRPFAEADDLRMVMNNVVPAGVEGARPGPYVVMDARWTRVAQPAARPA